MKLLVTVVAAAAIAASGSVAEAKGFLSALLRGGAKTAARAGVHAGVQSFSGIKTYGPDTLTIEQIETCLVFAQELDKSSEHLNALSDAINTESAAISQAQLFLATEKDLVDRYSETAVNAYNGKLAAMRARIAKHNAKVDLGQADQTRHNARVVSYNAECAKKYYADDMEATRLKLGIKAESN